MVDTTAALVFLSALFAFTVAIAVYDAWLLKKGKTTISEGMIAMSHHAPILAAGMALGIGILFGHFWWQISC